MNLKDPLWKMPEMGVFTSFLRKYLQSGEIDLVVHSWKDLPIEKDVDTVIVGTMPRADTRDLLLVNTEALREAYTTGHLVILSSSPRRKHNLPEFLKKSIPISPEGKEIRTVEFRDVRGNIQTRLLKLCETTGTDRPTGLIVAKAAIDRFLHAGSQFDEFKAAGELVRKCLDACLWQVLPLSVNPTAAAQGALAVEMLDSEKNADVRKKVADQINCDKTFGSVNEEREILKSLGGGCHQAIGCTILRRAFGKVTFLRGRTDKHQEDIMVSKIDSLDERKKTDSKIRAAGVEEFVSVGGKGGIQLFNREDVVGATAKIEKVLKKSKPAVGLYVAKSDALPENVKPESLKGRSVWTAGVQTWFSLAKRGVWVNGTSDSLGEGEPIDTYLLRNQSQDSGWIKLTHTEGSFDVSKGPNEFIDIIPTYRLKVKQGLDVDELIKGKRFFYFSSGSAYKAFVGLKSEIREKFLKGEWVAGCGPGNSLDTIKREIANVSVAYNFSDFVRQHS